MNTMKHRFLALLWTLVCLAGVAPDVFAQDYTPVPVTISRSKVNLNGKTYYAHIVLERQTIYGITRAYNVTEQDLYDANPMLAKEGLKSGTVIYIPTASEHKETPKAAPATTPATTPTTTPVKEKQVPVKEKTVPVKEKPAEKPVTKEPAPAPTPDENGYIQHTVKWFEDLYDVARQYGVSPDEVMAANGLKSSRISKRQTLLIPVTDKARESLKKAGSETVVATVPSGTEKTVPVTEPEPVQENPAEKAAFPEETKDAETDNVMDMLAGATGNGTAQLALVLPFNATGRTSESNMDFYSGVLMALRDLEKAGVKTTLNVYDLQAGVPTAYDLGKNDFVLGPITNNDLTTILGVTGGQVPVVSPLDQRAAELAQTHQGFIQAPSSATSQYNELAAWAAEECVRGDQIILVMEKTSSGSTAPAVGVREALVAAGTPFEGVSWTQGEGRSLPASLTARLTKNGVNRIIVASEKEAFVSDIVRNISILLGRGYKIVMYAPSRVRTFDSIDSSLYHQCSLHICSPYYADYDAGNVRAFIRTYRALYRTEPSQFAFQGYDLARYFASLVAKYGNRWTYALTREAANGIHTDFQFKPVRNGSYQNTAIRRIVYGSDYSTQLVR